MSKSSRKGANREREFADLFGGTKMSRLGYAGPDVITMPLRLKKIFMRWEIKSKEDLPLWLVGKGGDQPEGWLAQMKREGADAVVFRQNRGEWFAIIPISPKDMEGIE